MNAYVQRVLEIVKQRNHNEPIFIQAVYEVLSALEPVIIKNPEYEAFNILERICEPERQIIFRVTWQNDQGKILVNRGFRTQFNSTLGPYKGGLRFHPTVNMGIIKFLAFEQVFKNSLTGLPLGGAKGGSDFNPKGKSNNEIMSFCQAFMTEIHTHIGCNKDVPAGDIGVGNREIGYMLGQYKKLVNRYEPGVLTGKHTGWGGSFARKEATGYGCVYFAENMLKVEGMSLQGMRCVVSGSGNVAIYTIEKLQQLGATVIACSDSQGVVIDKEGLNLDIIKEIKEIRKGRVKEYLMEKPSAHYQDKSNPWIIPCDAAFPCATQNELNIDDAKCLYKNGCKLICEGSNMPLSNEAIHFINSKGILFGPAKAANAGGVSVSALEMQQNINRENWTFKEVDRRLKDIMDSIFHDCQEKADEFGSPKNYGQGANIASFERIATTVISFGI